MSSRCTPCAGMSIDLLVRLAKEEFKPRKFPDHAFYEHHRSFVDLEEAALGGCKFCQTILERFRAGQSPDFGYQEWIGWYPSHDVDSIYAAAKELLSSSDVKISMNYSYTLGDNDWHHNVHYDEILVQVGPMQGSSSGAKYSTTEEVQLPTLRLTVTSIKDEIPMVNGARVGRSPTDGDLASPANHKLTRQWLEDCQANHAQCVFETPQLPTRIIDVGSSGTIHFPRLLISRGKKAPYAALSHCWGGSIPTMLTRATLETFQVALPYELLPANFRDAITITRELGIQYLWIDSLCILQFDEEDWEKESRTMCDVYGNSMVTISAMAAESSTEGILRSNPKHPQRSNPAFINLRSGDNDDDVIVVGPKDVRERLEDLEYDCPLSRRGWTLQEFILGPRQLCYGWKQIHWKCPHGAKSADRMPYGSDDAWSTWWCHWPTILQVVHSRFRPELAPGSLDVEELLYEYYKLIARYSERKVTKDSDKLPALSGICRLLHQKIGGHYVAGLWSTDFNRGLLWQANTPLRHVPDYRAPSWSWAASDTLPYWPLNSESWPGKKWPKLGEHDLRLLQFGITPTERSNPFGKIASGYALVEALTIPLIRRGEKFNVFPMETTQGRGSCRFDEPYEPDVEPFEWLVLADTGTTNYLVSAHREYSYFFTSESCVAMIVKKFRVGEDSWVEGLVLGQVNNHSEVAYKRLGLFRIKWDLSKGDGWAWKQMVLI